MELLFQAGQQRGCALDAGAAAQVFEVPAQAGESVGTDVGTGRLQAVRHPAHGIGVAALDRLAQRDQMPWRVADIGGNHLLHERVAALAVQHVEEEGVVVAQLLLSIGTSGAVYPAAGFVQLARMAGARTVEINLEPSQGHSLFAEKRYGPATEQLPRWVAELLAG